MVDKKYVSHYQGKEIDDLLDKIKDLEIDNYYPKLEVDELLSKKADADKYYNKEQVDELETFEADTPNAQVTVGKLEEGTPLAGLSVKTVLKMILYGGAKNPVLVDPSFNCEITQSLFGVYGAFYTLKGTLKFDRGSITPDYGTSGFRAGSPYKYSVNDENYETGELVRDFSLDIASLKAGNNLVTAKVYYNEGEQPLNSLGAPFGDPYPAGEISKGINIIGLTASYSGLNNDYKKDELSTELIPIEDKDYRKVGLFGNEGIISGYQIKVPEMVDLENPQTILLPNSVKIHGIQSWDMNKGAWNWFYGDNAEETITAESWINKGVVEKDVDGVPITYNRFDYNFETYGAMGENYFRFLIKEK